MGTKFKCLTLAVVIALPFIYSCSKTAIKNVEIDSQWKLALFNENITINKLLENADSTSLSWLTVNEDGGITALYSNRLGVVLRGSDILSNLPTIEYKDTISLEAKSEQLVVPVEFDDIVVNRAVVKSGSMSVSIGNNIPMGNAKLTMTTANILTDNAPLSLELELKAGETSTTSVDLSNSIMNFNSENTCLVFDLGIDFNLKDMNGVDLFFNFGINNLAIKELEGSVKNIMTNFDNVENIDFGLEKISGDLTLSPKLNLEYKNSFGIGLTAVVDTFGFVTKNGELYSLINGDAAFLTLNENVIEEYKKAEIQNIVNQVDIDNDYCKLNVSGYALMGDSRGDAIMTEDSKVDLIGNVELPLEFTAKDLSYNDTIDMSFGDVESVDMLDEIGFHIIINNTLPLTIKPRLLLLDPEDGSVALSIVPEGSVAAGSYNGVPVKSVIDIQIDKNDFNTLFNARQMQVKCTVDTEGRYVKLNKDQYFGMNIGMTLHSSSISLDSDK